MASEPFIRRYRNWYAKLLRLYPKPHRERFGEGMEQTFNDLCRERVKAERGLFSFALWMFFETSAGIIRENATIIMTCSMKRGSTIFLKIVISLIAIAALAVCAFALPLIVGQEAAKQRPETAYLPHLFLLCAYILSVPFFAGLYQAFKLLNYQPEEKLAVAYTTNAKVYPVKEIVSGVIDIYYNKPFQIPTFKTIAVSPEVLDKYVGVYSSLKFP